MASSFYVGGVGAGLSQAQFQVQYQAHMLKEQQNVAKALGAEALELIRAATAATTGGSVKHDLDVQA
mgnify:CR=1 FL=1